MRQRGRRPTGRTPGVNRKVAQRRRERAEQRGHGAPVAGDRKRGLFRTPLAKTLMVGGAFGLALITAIATGLGQSISDRISEKTGLKPTQSPADGAQPFIISVITDYDSHKGFALPSALEGGPQAAAVLTGEVESRWTQFLRETDGAPREKVGLRLVFTGTRNVATRITGIAVHKERIGPNFAGTSILPSPQGESSVIPVRVDLDRAQPQINDKNGNPYFLHHNIDLERNERVTVAMTCTAKNAAYRWTLSVDYIDNEGKHTLHIDNTGRPRPDHIPIPRSASFLLTGKARKYDVEYESNFPSPGYHVK